MRNGGRSVDVAIYGKALVHLARHPSILVLPLLAAVVDMLLSYWSTLFTDPLGGIGAGLFQFVIQIVYLFAFGVAVIQANNLERGYRAGFDDAWEDGRRKAMGIILAAIGFQFITWMAGYIGGFLGIPLLQIALQAIAYFFLILTIPAAAIGGLPGSLAVSGSIRAVRTNWPACILLAVAFVALWVFVPNGIINAAGMNLGVLGTMLVLAAIHAIVLAYLAFPFAKTYDETAFRGYY